MNKKDLGKKVKDIVNYSYQKLKYPAIILAFGGLYVNIAFGYLPTINALEQGTTKEQIEENSALQIYYGKNKLSNNSEIFKILTSAGREFAYWKYSK